VPGGVSAAALAAAMGAALCAKVTRLTLARQPLSNFERDVLVVTLSLAEAHCVTLRRLAIADEQAYRTVLHVGGHEGQGSSRSQAWQRATEVPIEIAEACCSLLDRLPALHQVCRPSAHVDLQVGGWLLKCGMRAGLGAAECNLRVWGDTPEAHGLRSRLDALLEVELD
jgi:formiminotetrahydrofolate cyclodeaminase